jgi:hypothetical protein
MLIRSLAMAMGLTGAVSFAQYPEYAQQYVQRLGGAVDELAGVATLFDAAASAAGVTRAQALAELQGSAFLDQHGRDMAQTLARYDALKTDLAVLQSGTARRLALLPTRMDTDIAARTWEAFQPAVPVTPTGLGFAGGGFVAGWGLFTLLTLPFRRRRHA